MSAHCHSCGEEVRGEARFCPNCGADLAPRRRRLWAVLGGALAVAGLAAVATIALLVTSGDPQASDPEGSDRPSPLDLPEGVVAVVTDVDPDLGEVTRRDLSRALGREAAQDGLSRTPKPGTGRHEELQEAALEGLLDLIWIQGEAEEMGIEVSDREIAAKLKAIKGENFESEAEFTDFQKESGFTERDIDERLKVQIISAEIEARIKNRVTRREIESYYETARSTQFTRPATREARLIVNEDRAKIEEAKELLEDDRSAASWGRVASRFSEDDVTKESGGLQVGLSAGGLEEPLGEAVFGAPEGRVEGPVETGKGFYVFAVEGSTEERVLSLDDAEAQIRSVLRQEKRQEKFQGYVDRYEERWRSRTVCAPAFAIERCSNGSAPDRAATGALATP